MSQELFPLLFCTGGWSRMRSLKYHPERFPHTNVYVDCKDPNFQVHSHPSFSVFLSILTKVFFYTWNNFIFHALHCSCGSIVVAKQNCSGPLSHFIGIMDFMSFILLNPILYVSVFRPCILCLLLKWFLHAQSFLCWIFLTFYKNSSLPSFLFFFLCIRL